MTGLLRLCMLAFVSLVAGQILTQDIKQEGVMFEKMSDVLVYHNSWKVFTKLAVINKEELLEYLDFSVNQTEAICNCFQEMEKETECNYWKKEMAQETDDIKNRIQGLKIFLKTNRPRRGLINAVGKLSRFLFGTMDADDAEDISEKLKALDAGNKQTLHLVEKQVSITKTNMKSIESILGNISDIQQDFDTRLTQMESETRRLHDMVGNLLLNRLMLATSNRIERLHRYLSDQYEIITALKLHILHPLLLSVEDLKTIYGEIAAHERQVALNYHITSQIITVNMEIIDNEIWVQITIPLIEPQVFTMYHAYELPTVEDNSITYILDIEYNFLLNNSRTQNFIELSQQNIEQQCKLCEIEPNLEILACRVPQARIIGTKTANCLINLFQKREKEAKSCKHKVSYHINEMLIKLHTENSWLYLFRYPQNLMAQCTDSLRHFQLEGAGILTLTQECKYSINAFELPYVKVINSTLQFHQTTKEELPRFPLDMRGLENTKRNNKKGHLQITQHNDFHAIMKAGVKDLDDLEREVKHAQTYDPPAKLQNHTNSSLIILIIMVLVTVMIVKWRRYRENKRNTMQPEVIVLPNLTGQPERKTKAKKPEMAGKKTQNERRSMQF